MFAKRLGWVPRFQLAALVCIATVLILTVAVRGQTALSGAERGVHAFISLEGFNPLKPTLRKWVVPQELYWLYNWGGWQYTNYAREHYRRYVDIELEGLPYYDTFGDYIVTGWELYSWQQQQPGSRGSVVYKSGRFSGWFDRLLIAYDAKGEYHTSLTVGEAIRTTLTPLTFSKPAFNGLQWDFLSDKYAVTLLTSRSSRPEIASGLDILRSTTNFCNLFGLRGTIQLGGVAKVGATYVTSPIGVSTQEWSQGSLHGILSTDQNSGNIREVVIRISDDSSDDLEGGATFYSARLLVDGKRTDVKPRIDGGIRQEGVYVALGAESIELHYTIPDPTEVEKIGFDLVLADDYKVEVTSNLQTNGKGQPVYLLVTRAEGNVKDNSNQQVFHFDYGLPTGNEIYGFTLDVDDIMGFTLRGEYDVNTGFRRFPNINLEHHTLSSDKARAFFLNVNRTAHPWYGFGEFFNIDYNYNTSAFIPNPEGFIDYESDVLYTFEYIDDNDDQDRFPDWQRANELYGSDGAVFPGLDENNDLRPDYNQNNNLLPDYEEPFLRYNVDPPEFLFGMDMNNNTVIDRLENDDAPDYPYKKDHRGYNLYVGREMARGVHLAFGHLNEWLVVGDGRNRSDYALFTLERDWAGLGKLSIFNDLKIVKDDIADDLIQWIQRAGTLGGMQPFSDPLLAKNSIINTAYAQFGYIQVPHLNVVSKMKYEIRRHRGSMAEELEDTYFLGVLNKSDYSLNLRKNLMITARAKSMYRKQTQSREELLDMDDFKEILSLIFTFPVLMNSSMAVGFEYFMFFNRVPLPEIPPAEYVDDFRSRVFSVQLSNAADYLGYRLITNAGFQMERKRFRTLTKSNITTTGAFVRIFAGAQ